MPLSEQIAEAYSGIEERFYGLMDFLADKGIPVYSAIDPLEERGIPFFPVAVASLCLIAFLSYGLLFLSSSETSLTLSITDNTNAALSGVSIKAFEEGSGKEIQLGSSVFVDGQVVKVPRGKGAKIMLEASKQGYETAQERVFFDSDSKNVEIRLVKETRPIEASLRLVDGDTGDAIGNAKVVAYFSESGSVECIEGDSGNYTCPGVIEGGETRLKITQANYEQKELETKFEGTSTNEISLAPKASAALGNTNLIVRVFDADTKQRLGNFNMKVFDSKDNGLITERAETDGDGEQVERVAKGTSVRVVVEKQDYISYDSGIVQENETLREDETIREVYLRKGTNALTAGVADATGRPMDSVSVYLFNALSEIVSEKQTSLAGEVVFESLSTEDTYYVSAWGENFLPAIAEVRLSEKNRVNLKLERGTASNSGSLTVYTTDEKSIALNGASLNFFIDENSSGLKPLGIPAQKTDITGKFTILVPLGKNVLVKAARGKLYGEASAKVIETFKNEILITMREPFTQVLLKVLGEDGKEQKEGFISIVAGNDSLFEGEYGEGGITFNPKANKYVSVSFTGTGEEAFTEEVYVQDQNTVTVSKGGKGGAGTTPLVEFLGVYNVDNTKAEGLSKGIDYFLKFKVAYPTGTSRNGLHVRLGEDGDGFADSQDAGITGFSAVGASSFYGRSYSPNPAPGFEALDFENSGTEGGYSKWLELYFASGGEKIVKVRAKAKETAKADEVELHYRAWSLIGDRYYRQPGDDDLQLEQYSKNKTSLYAQTSSEKIRILEASASCSNELCASYKFVRRDGSEYSAENFRAVLGELYALDITLSPSQAASVTVKGSTAKQKPKISFQGFGIDSFAQFPDNNSSDTSIQVDNVSAKAREATGVRLYFKANDVENSSITLQLISGQTNINEQFHFSVYKEKTFALRTIPENVTFGEDFVLLVQDSEAKPVEGAEIRLSRNGEIVQTIKGNGSGKKGANGRYAVKNSFDAGIVKYEINGDGFRPLEGTIEITKNGLLEWPEAETALVIQKEKKNAQKFIEIINRSKQNIKGLSFEVKPITALPEGLEIKVSPISNLGAGASQKVVLSADYSGQRETDHGEVRIIAKGRTDAGFTVAAEMKVIADYNPKISADCVEFSKDRLAVYVASGLEDRDYYDRQYSQQGGSQKSASGNLLPPNQPTSYYKYNTFTATTNETFTAKLANKAQCQVELALKPEISSQGSNSQGLEVGSGDIILVPQVNQVQGNRTDTREVVVSISNKLIRNYPGKQRFGFDIVYKSEGFTKSIPLDVYVWNPRYALEVSRNIELYLGPNDRGELSAQVPLFVRNTGEADIENVSFRVSSATNRGNVDVRVVPDFPIQFLKKGQAIIPPQTLVAQATRNEKTTLVDVKQLDITGVIDGQTFSFGPVILTSHVSGAQCLTAVPGNFAFISTKATEGAIAQELTLRNTCAEEVRVLGISQAPIGNNKLTLAPQNAVIFPGTEAKFNLVLEKHENFNGTPVKIYVQGFLPRSGAPIESSPVIIDLKLGRDVAKGTAASELVTLNVCEGGKKEVRFPVIASGTSALCDNAYCDAVQMSNFLADRLDEKIRDAEKQIQNRSSEIQKSDCTQENLARGFCTFDGLGVKKETFFVYFSHDNLSPAILQKALQGKNTNIRNYRVDYIQGGSGGEYLGGYSRQVFLNNSFRGCGRYTVSLNGSVSVQGSRLVPELMNIVVDITSDELGGTSRQVTEQCLPNIQNMSNFLPRDEGLTRTQKLDTWMSVVEPKDKSLEELSVDVAKTLFGNEQRVVEGSIGTNALSFDLGSSSGYVVRVEMVKAASESPVSINALVRQSIGADEKLQKEIVKDAGQAIKGLRENVVDGCIGADESYMLLKTKNDSGTLEVNVKGNVPVQFQSPQCAELTITSNIRDSVALSGRKLTQFDGIKGEPFFKSKKERETDEGQIITTLAIDKLDQKTNRFSGEARVCVEGNAQFAQAHEKKIAVGAARVEGTAKKPKEVEAGLEVCGIHPLKFLNNVREKDKFKPTKGNDYYYATFIWKGDPETIRLSDFTKLSETQERVDKADQILDNKRAIQKTDTPEVVSAKRKAGVAYLGGCSLTSAITTGLRPIIGWNPGIILLNILGDCVIPFTHLMADVSPVAKFVDDIGKAMIDGIAAPIKFIGSLFGGGGSGGKVESVAKEISTGNATASITEAFALQAVVKDTLLANKFTFDPTKYEATNVGIKGFSKARIVGEEVANGLVEKLHKEAFGGSAAAEVTAFLDDFKTKFLAEVDNGLIAGTKGNIKGGVYNEAAMKEIMAKAVDKVGADSTVLDNFAKAKGGINVTTANSFIEKDAISKEILSEVDKVPQDVVTKDISGPANITEATKDAAKLRLEADTKASLKRKVTESYAEKMGITFTEAETAIGTRLDGIDVKATEDFGPTKADITTTQTQAFKDVVSKEVTSTAKEDLAKKIAEKSGLDIGTTRKLVGEELGNVDAKIRESLKAGNKLESIGGTIIEGIEDSKARIAEKIASKTGKTLEDATKLVEAAVKDVDSTVNSTVTKTISEKVTSEAGPKGTTTTTSKEHYFKTQVTKAEQDEAVNAMRRKLNELTKEAIDNPGRHPSLDRSIDKVFKKKGMSQVTTALKGKIDPKEGIPKFWGKGGILFLKNLFKEGAFGLLANFVGISLYDKILNSELKKSNYDSGLITRDQEIAQAGIGYVPEVFTAEAGSQNYILKYRTYRVAVTSLADGKKEIKLGLANSIPGSTKKELILNDCKDQGFDEGVGAVLPGLLPVVDNESKMPTAFRKTEELKTLHVKIARNYLAKQPNGERFGQLINSAIKDKAQAFNAPSVGMNLEALVVSIGIVKSQLGNDPNIKSDYMFGCSLGAAGSKDVHSNAKCAAEKLASYIPQCKDVGKNKASCFLNEYNNDPREPKNQKSSSRLLSVGPDDFQDIYDTWASQAYAWKAT